MNGTRRLTQTKGLGINVAPLMQRFRRSTVKRFAITSPTNRILFHFFLFVSI